MDATGTTSIKSPLFSITLAKGRDIVVIDNADSLPDEFVNVKTTVTPDKAAILKALKDGPLPGAHFEKSLSSIRIK